MFLSPVFGNTPGITAAVTTYENQFSWGGANRGIVKGEIIVSTALDAGSSPSTSRLRAGLIMGKITASGKLKEYAPNSTDGSEIAYGVLLAPMMLTDNVTASAVDKFWGVLVAGPVQASKLLLLDQKARADMYGRFIFDDAVPGNSSGWRNVVAKTSAYAVTAADNNTIFTNLGASAAVAFTLPAIAKGLRYRFYSEDNDGFTVSSATADTMVAHNDVDIDTVAFTTTARNIGAALEVYANSDATKWLCFPYTWNIADDGSTTTKATLTD